MTFSIVACDLRSEPPQWGVAVASKFLAVGAVVPSVEAGVGAVATQAFANAAYGPEGLRDLRTGAAAEAVLQALTAADDQREERQVGIVDANGRAATFTGSACPDWAGGRIGDGYCCQGNILTGADVVDAMADAFEKSSGDLTERLFAALAAGDNTGGDRRGRQSAAIIVAGKGAGYLGGSDVAIDLRVDDHERPIQEMARLLDVHRFYFPAPSELEFQDVDEEVVHELRDLLARVGIDTGNGSGYDDALKRGLFEFVGIENLEMRWSDEPMVEQAVLAHLRSTAG